MYIHKFTNLYNFPKISITDKELDILQYILEGNNSAYDIFLRINKKKGIAYKNVHITVKKLKDLRLIETRKVESKNVHRAIRYKLTDTGLFNIFAERFLFDLSSMDSVQTIVDSIIIKELLGVIFESKNLIAAFFTINALICIYLHECCKAIKYGSRTALDFDIFFPEDEDIDNTTENNIKSKTENLRLDYYLNSRLKLFVIDLIFELTDQWEMIEIEIDQDNELHDYQGELRQFADELKSLLTEDKNFMALTEKINENFKKGYNILTNKDYLLEYYKKF